MHNVLKSWAVPKGVPYEIGERRLAMATEDHPIDYLDFEGSIPQGQYGGGTVMVWDIGTYELIEGNYYKGELQLHVKGKKLKGEWRLAKDRTGKNKNWFLMKTGKSIKPRAENVESTSALTGRTMDQIAADKTAQWHSNRTSIPGLDLDELPRSDLKFVEPMLAKAVDDLPSGDGWEYEIKLDGYRALAIKDGGEARLLSRRNNLLNDRFEQIATALNNIGDGVMLDGEIVGLDAAGRPSFNLLQRHKENNQAIVFYLFDVLAYRGRDVRQLPISVARTDWTAADHLRHSRFVGLRDDKHAQDVLKEIRFRC